MIGSSYTGIAYRRKEEGMASTIHRQRRISSRARVFLGVLGAGLLGLLLAAPLGWSQTTDITILQVSIIAPESGEMIDSDCFQLDHITGAFTSDLLSTQGASNGVWYAIRPAGSAILVHGSCESATYSRSGRAKYRLLWWRARSKQWRGGWGYCSK